MFAPAQAFILLCMDVPLKPYKRDSSYSYALGVFPTLELLDAQPESVLKVLVSSRGARNEGVAKIEGICARAGIKLEANDRAVDRLSQRENTFAVGVFRKYTATLDAGKNHLALVNPGDMGNLGTIARTMLGFGVRDLAIVRPAVDIFDPKVVRASMGALFRLRACYFDTFEEYQAAYAGHNLYPFMTDGEVSLREATFREPSALVFGSESSGLPPHYRTVGTPVRIRHSLEIDSLSLPISVGIALYRAATGVELL